MSDFNDHNYLCHYGIKGMKWGVRRFENPDGTLTPAGRKRYSSMKRNEQIRQEFFKSVSEKNEKLKEKDKQKTEELWKELEDVFLSDNVNEQDLISIFDKIDYYDTKNFNEAKTAAEKEIFQKYGDVGINAITNATPFDKKR